MERFGKAQALDMIDFRNLFWEIAGYTPTPLQAQVLEAARWTKLISGGVRGGKSMTTAMLLVDFLTMPGEIIWIIGANYEAPREEFLYLHKTLTMLGLVSPSSVSMPRDKSTQWLMDVAGGAHVATKSSYDVDSIASVAPIAQAYIEAAQQDPDIFDKAYERGLQKDALIVFSGTLEAAKQLTFTNKLIEWRNRKDDKPTSPEAWSLPTYSNIYEFPGGKDDPKFIRLIENMTPEKVAERIEAVPYKPSGAVHKRFSEENIVPLTMDPELPVEIAIDPGYTSYVALFIQRHGEYVHVLDEIYRHEALTHDIVDEVMAHEYWPHVKWGIIDKAARQHQAQESVWEVWRRLTGIPLVTRAVSVQDGIDAIEMRCLPGEDGLPRLLVNEAMRFHVTAGNIASSLRAEFNLRQYPKYHIGKSSGVQPIKANDHALNALGYYLFYHYRQERKDKNRPNPTGVASILPQRLKRYERKPPNYAGNKSRAHAYKRIRTMRI